MVKGSGYRPYVAREPSLAAIRGAFLLLPFLCVERTDKTKKKIPLFFWFHNRQKPW
jgi:hypothetical protein